MWVFRLYWYQKYCTESIPQLVQAKVQFNFTCEINTTLLDRILPSQLWHTHYSESEWFFSSSRVSGSFYVLATERDMCKARQRKPFTAHTHTYIHSVGTPPPPLRMYFRSKRQLIVLYFFELYSQLKQNINCTQLYSAIQDIGGSTVLIDWLNTGKARSI